MWPEKKHAASLKSRRYGRGGAEPGTRLHRLRVSHRPGCPEAPEAMVPSSPHPSPRGQPGRSHQRCCSPTGAAKPPSTSTAPSTHPRCWASVYVHRSARASLPAAQTSWQEMGHLRRPRRPLPTGAAELGLPGERQAQQVPVHVESRVEGSANGAHLPQVHMCTCLLA